MDKIIKQEIRRVLLETMQQFQPAFPLSGGANKFPYNDSDNIVQLPEDINTKEDYVINWKDVSENNDLYNFPLDEFKKGIYVEKAKKSLFNILDVAEIVINNLKENPQFYTNLGV